MTFNFVLHKQQLLSVDDRTMKELGLRPGQDVDEAMVRVIIEHTYAWCLTELEIAKARTGSGA